MEINASFFYPYRVFYFLAGSLYPLKMQFEVTKADSHKRTANNSIDVVIPEELQVRVILKIDIETSVCVP